MMAELTEIRKMLSADDEEIRLLAVRSLQGCCLSDSCSLLFLAMADDNWRVRKEAVEIFVSSDPEELFIAKLLDQLRNEENAGLRNSAAEALIRLGNRAGDLLLSQSGNGDADVRKFVIDTMGAIAAPRFFPTLRLALCDPDENVAAAAAEQLGNCCDSSAVQDLVTELSKNGSLLFQFSALTALGKLNAHLAVPEGIIALAKQDILRKGVYECLGSIGDESSCPILLDGFQSRQKSSRAAAVFSWHRIYERATPAVRVELEATLRRLSGSPVVSHLLELCDGADSHIVKALTDLLGIIGDVRAVPALLQACSEARHLSQAIDALRMLGDTGLAALVSLYHTVDATSRAVICKLVGEQKYLPGSMAVRDGVGDPLPIVHTAAVIAAARLSLADCIPGIASLFSGADSSARAILRSALQSLIPADRHAVREVVCRLSESDLAENRYEAAMLHTALGDGDQLFLLAKDEDSNVRQAAISGIGILRCEEYRDLIHVFLADEAPAVRIAAAEALATFGGNDLADVLLTALHDEDAWVQSTVLKSIQRIAPERLLPLLESLFATADGILMLTCLELLEQVATPPAWTLVASALSHQDEEISLLAAAILSRNSVGGAA